MRIAIDGYNLALPHGTGVASYGRTLAEIIRSQGHGVEGVFGIDVGTLPETREALFFERLARRPRPKRHWGRWLAERTLPVYRPRMTEVPLTGLVEARGFADRLPRFDRIVSSPDLFDRANRFFARTGRFLTLDFRDPPDIMHWTYPVPIRLRRTRNIYTLHDLVPLKLPHTTLDNKAVYRRLVERCARESDHVVTDSEASRADILSMLEVSPERVTNTYLAADLPPEAFAASAAEDAATVRGTYGLEPRSYFLYLGAIEPRKNLARLIEAYLSLDTGAPLVIAGQGEAGLELLASGALGPAAQRVVRLGFVPRAMLLRLVRSARAVCFPSLYEGFGLPVLEAMQLSTPVLTSTESSLPEVAGDAALLVDPYSVRAIADGLRALDGDAALRARLAAAGPVRAEHFSAARFAVAINDVYRAVLAS